MNTNVLAKIITVKDKDLVIETVEIPLNTIEIVQEMRNDLDEFYSWLLSVSDIYKIKILTHIFKNSKNYVLNLSAGKNIGFSLDEGTVIMGTDFDAVQVAINNMYFNMVETLDRYGFEDEND